MCGQTLSIELELKTKALIHFCWDKIINANKVGHLRGSFREVFSEFGVLIVPCVGDLEFFNIN